MGSNEKKYLRFILKKLSSDEKNRITSFWSAVFLWIVLVLIVMGASILYKVGIIGVGTLLVFVGILGVITGCLAMARFSEQYWILLKKHIDKNSILRRIDELDA